MKTERTRTQHRAGMNFDQGKLEEEMNVAGLIERDHEVRQTVVVGEVKKAADGSDKCGDIKDCKKAGQEACLHGHFEANEMEKISQVCTVLRVRLLTSNDLGYNIVCGGVSSLVLTLYLEQSISMGGNEG